MKSFFAYFLIDLHLPVGGLNKTINMNPFKNCERNKCVKLIVLIAI